MPLYALRDSEPEIDPDAFVHPDAVLIGAVRVGAESSVWPGAVLRGDNNRIEIGRRTSIQDNAVLHTIAEHPTTVGDECVIGHLVHLEGCTLESRVLVGVGAVVLHRAVVRTGAVVGANAVVLNGTEVPPGALAVGTPATIRPDAARPDDITHGVEAYIDQLRRYRQGLRRIG